MALQQFGEAQPRGDLPGRMGRAVVAAGPDPTAFRALEGLRVLDWFPLARGFARSIQTGDG
jgi:hypothetical protein